jgi:hypothetical protein
MNGGVIKVKEVDGAAFTMTALNPGTDKGFTVDASQIVSIIGASKMGTFYANAPMTIPAGVSAYVAVEQPVVDNGVGTITLTAIADGIVPAETGVVLRAEEGQYTFVETDEAGTAVENNLLLGYAGANAYVDVELTEGTTSYVLTTGKNQVGFYRKDQAFKVYNNKAYLQVPEVKLNVLRLRFENADGTTDITELPVGGAEAQEIFDLTGRRVATPAKGIYIVNGKKVRY